MLLLLLNRIGQTIHTQYVDKSLLAHDFVRIVGQCEMWNEVVFWFTQFMYYNVYIPLLLRLANDVEENPGPAIFNIVDPTRTVSADFSQGDEVFGENAGKQCVGMSLTAIIYHRYLEHFALH